MNAKVLKIGNVELDSPFLLAPMAGITDGPFRRICREMGAGLVYSEMVSAKGLWFKDKNTGRLLEILMARSLWHTSFLGMNRKS